MRKPIAMLRSPRRYGGDTRPAGPRGPAAGAGVRAHAPRGLVRALAAESASDAGLTLIEVVISAMLVAIIAIATLTGFDSAGRATADERAHGQATLLAGKDEERLRALGAAALTRMQPVTKTYTENGTQFSVESSARFVTVGEEEEALACESSPASADYIQTTSKVTWSTPNGTRKPVSQSSIVAIPVSASLLVRVKNQNNEPVQGASVTVTGTSTKTEQQTPTSGCVIFGALAEAEKEVEVVVAKGSWVNTKGESSLTPPAGVKIKLTAEATTSYETQLAEPGAITAEFISNTSTVGVTSDTFFATETSLSAPFVGGTAGVRGASTTLTELFPFASVVSKPPTVIPYTVYAGDCTANDPAEVTKKAVTDPTAPVEPNKTTKVK